EAPALLVRKPDFHFCRFPAHLPLSRFVGRSKRRREDNITLSEKMEYHVWNRAVVVEELGIRDGIFGYVSAQYDRWTVMRERLNRILVPAIEVALDVADAKALKLEYWDSFVFEDVWENACASKLLSARQALVPDTAYDGPENWHSHIGWFERVCENRLLINQNFDAVNLRRERDDVEKKALNIYALTEQRFENWKLDSDNISKTLDFLHDRSVQLFAASINDAQREAIGIDENGAVNA
ncbi:MAG: hypothetical protein OXC66_11130, partial [Roseovarius sp.]|nr:hypothetical protein [Roseovarius sp.]